MSRCCSFVMPDLIRHPVAEIVQTALDSPSTLLRVVSLSNHGSSPECEDLGPMDLIHNPDKNVQTRNYLIFISISLVVTAVLYFFDVPIWHAARDLAEPDYLLVPEFLSDWGLYLFYTIFSILFVVGLIKKRPNLINIALAYIKAQLVFSLLVVRLLKFVLGRPRPGYGFELILFTTRASHHSFPSGHSADAFASGVCLFYLLSQSKYCRRLERSVEKYFTPDFHEPIFRKYISHES